ncbi:MAG: BTAD domain-containing putative transcriptional regulator [Gemmatimonadota bacterium]
MLRLHTFGGLWLEESDPESRVGAGPRRRLALLAILAASGPRGISRDRLLLLLWPDSTEANARHALSQLLYMLRRDAGVEIVTGAAELRIDPAVMTSDLADFETALKTDEPERAAELYKGPLADGFYLENGEEFERWAAEMRAALARRALGALEAAARRAGERSDRKAVVEYRHRLTQLEPLSAPFALAYMEALAQAGDRGTAIRFAQEYESIVRRELRTPAEPAIRALAQRLAAELHISSPAEAPAPPNVALRQAPAETQPRPETAGPGSLARRLPWIGAAAVLVVVVGFVVWKQRGAGLEPDLFAVARFENRTGDPKLDLVGEMAADWIMQGLAQMRTIRVVDPQSSFLARQRSSTDSTLPQFDSSRSQIPPQADAVARALNAGHIVWGTFYRTGDSLTFLAHVSDANRHQVVRTVAPITGPSSDPLVAITALQRAVMGAVAVALDKREGDYGPISARPPSYEAYQAYLEAWDFINRYDSKRAIERLDRAAALDTSFLAPRLWAVSVYDTYGYRREADSVLGILEARRDRLSPAERLIADGFRAYFNYDLAGSLQTSRELVGALPGPSSYFMLANDALAVNRPQEALAALKHIAAGSWFTKGWDSWAGYVWKAYHLLGENDKGLGIAREGRRDYPDSPLALQAEAKALAALGRTEDAMTIVQRAMAMAESEFSSHISPFAVVCLELAARGDSAAARTVGSQGLALPLPDSLTGVQLGAKVSCLACAGRWAELRDIARRHHDSRSDEWYWLGFAGIASAHLGDRTDTERVDRLLAAIIDRYSFGQVDFMRARIAAQLGESDRAVGLLQQAFARGYNYMEAFEAHPPEFLALRSRADFQEMMRPKG